MGINYNPRIVNDGLVLYVDAANPKSYSQNVFPYPLDGYSWGTSGYQMTVSRDTSTSSPVGNSPLKLVTSGTSAFTNTYNSPPFTLSPAAQGQTWTFSFWVKGSSSFSASMLIFESNSSGGYIAYGQPYYSITTEWTRVSGSYTMTQATTAGVQVRIDCYVNGVTLWVDGFQLEKASSVSSFNSISNTNGTTWRDLIGNGNTGTLTNGPTYSSANGGSIVFDGADDYILGTIPSSTFSGAHSIGCWFYRRTVKQWSGLFSTNVGTTSCPILTFIDSTNIIGTNQAGVNGAYVGIDLGADHLNKWIYCVMTVSGSTNGSTVNVYAYKDGSLLTATGSLYWTLSSSSSYYIGRHFQGDVQIHDGNIPQVSVYNRALTAAEVSQNFNALRSRFSI
jgi:hypothetical protein